MRQARRWFVALLVLGALVVAGCAEKSTNPFDASQDRNPPVVTSLSYEDGVVTWTTDEPALCVIEYGIEGGDYRNYVYESSKEFHTHHTATVLGMTGGDDYDLRIRSRDRAGNEDYDTDVPFPVTVEGTSFTGPTMRLSMIDVGWGLSMAFETPNGTTALIDAGQDIHAGDVETFLYDHNISYLDYAVVTHYHDDHYGGFVEDGGIFDTFAVGTVIGPDTTYILAPMVSSFRDKLDQHHLDYVTVKQGDDSSNKSALAWDSTPGFSVEVLSAGIGTQFAASPDLIPEDAEPNNDSIVFRFTFDGVSFLTMADGEFFTEHYILDRYGPEGVRADVLQVAHHANDDGSSELWLENVNPRVGLISNSMIEAALEKEVVLQGLRAVDADYMATDRIIPNTPRDAAPTYGNLVAVTDGETFEIITEEHDW